ncbi:AAA family ATPase [Streptomyces sp. NPDC051940]|uniref:AAA family ATPase n=1 Tax=Streptomyces sp. NPDC051940 TaxID=3155675 RepID=UPI00341D42BA
MVLVQLDAELTSLISALDASASGRSTLVLVEGAVGCGKSEFLETATCLAVGRGALVLRAFGDGRERGRPLGVLAQLAHGARQAGAGLALPAEPEDAGRVEALQAFAAEVHRLAENRPVVVCVDDLHQVDDVSRLHLLHLARGSRSVPLLLLYATALPLGPGDPLTDTELLRQPHLERIRLGRLGLPSVRALLENRTEAEADRLHQVSGGNPLLLRALSQDPQGRPGGHYAQAVLACLRRCGPVTEQVARAVAVLDGHGTPDLVAQLAGVGPAAVTRVGAALTAAGLLDGGRLCHPAARTAVLEDMDADALRALRRRAGLLAHQVGAPTAVIAAQLLGAGHADEEWAPAVLLSAAGQFLADGSPAQAAECLELAYEASPDQAHREEMRIRLAAVATRTDPAAAEAHLAEPLRAVRAGGAARPWLAALARALAAQGRIEESVEVLGRIAPRPGAREPATAERRPDPLDGLSAFPQWAADWSAPARADGQGRTPREGTHPAALWAVPEARGGAAHAAELYLRGVALTDDTVAPVVQALRAVLYSGGPDQAVPWCEVFAARSEQRGAAGWYAAFAGLLAEARMRLGDLEAAAAALWC